MKGDYRISYYEIKKPIWNGGYDERQIGIAPGRLAGINELRINISYRNKNGDLIYPNTFSISPKFFHKYEGEWTSRYGTRLKLFYIKDLDYYNPNISETKRIMYDNHGVDEEPIILREINKIKVKE
jgi:hypothetical protein|tara:strand:+ start:469 stop:846 length:378 start_codon:yes stop_codon:yes gene_type:complete